MAEFKFSCQQCGQHIQLDDLWSGHQIDCPACNKPLVVPQNPAAASAPPPPTPPAGPRLSKAASAAHAPASAPLPAQTRFVPGRPQPKAPTKAPIGKWAAIAGGVVALGVGCYFGYPFVQKWQDDINAKHRAEVKNSGGGEMGHIAALYQVEAATEPGGPGFGRMRGPSQRRSGPAAIEVPRDDDDRPAPTAAAAMPSLPPAQAVWTLDPGVAPIPDGRVNGKIAGTNFVVESARIETSGTARVLRLTQGPLATPERQLLIFLHPKVGTNVVGQSWEVSKDMTGSAVPQIKKEWKTDPRFAAVSKTFFNGYAMKLEMGDATNGTIAGRIFISLPDTEQSVVAGSFNASVIAGPQTTAMAPTAPTARQSRYDANATRQGRRMQQ